MANAVVRSSAIVENGLALAVTFVWILLAVAAALSLLTNGLRYAARRTMKPRNNPSPGIVQVRLLTREDGLSHDRNPAKETEMVG